MPCKLFSSNCGDLPEWEHFPSKVCEILDPRPENVRLVINVAADRAVITITIKDLDGGPLNWEKEYELDQKSILGDITKKFKP
jgi:hypothetical protein